jgi:uncharacterized SAM-binding protein YcdF (DUF218 family)
VWGELKPLLSALVLPPASPLVLAAIGLIWSSRQRWARHLVWVGLVLAWLLSTQGVAVWLSERWLRAPTPNPALLQKPAQAFAPTPQAVVVLGGGADPNAVEWPNGTALHAQALERLAYGVALAQHWQLPLAFSGGVGWAAPSAQSTAEAEVAARTAQRWGYPVRWLEGSSRDTAENANHTADLLSAQGIHQVALVTHAWHMPRAALAFERAGLRILPAPMGAITRHQSAALLWLPSGTGARACRAVLHEVLGQWVAQGQHRLRTLPH